MSKSPKDIMESKRMIAEFMGETGKTKVSNGKVVPYDKTYNYTWDNLMPVVEKIESLGHSVLIDSTQCKIFMDHDYVNSYKDSKIEAVYASVTKWLEWYNSQPLNER